MPSITLVNPRKRRKARRASPKRRKAHRRIKRRAARRASPRRSRRRKYRVAKSYRRNPIGGFSAGGAINSIKAGAIAATGAVALDVVMGLLPIPDNLKSGPLGVATKAAGAIGLGLFAGRFLGRGIGMAVTEGGLTILAYNVIKPQVAKFLPNVALGEYVNGMGEYVNGLGYLSPAQTLGYGATGFGAMAPVLPDTSSLSAGFGGGDDDPFDLNSEY